MATAASAARFLAVESCGQCEPCKSDGLAVAVTLGGVTAPLEADARSTVDEHLRTIADGARCSLAQQHQTVVTSLLDFAADHEPVADGVTVEFLPIASLDGGQAVLDTEEARRNPDWSLDQPDSGAWPAARLSTMANSES